jgi:uncharacterized membrane protein
LLQTKPSSSKDDQLSAWFERNYLKIILISLFIFTALPIIAPVFVKAGFEFPARLIYWVYSNFCHQLPYRSWFLFGAQPYYPLNASDSVRMVDFINAFKYTGELEQSRLIIGNETNGYKIAVCQRDLAMYLGLFLSGTIFSFSGKKWRKIPLWAWLLFGVLPLGIDGFTQLTGSRQILTELIPWRESTPLLRTLTGAAFGVFTGFYVFPALEARVKINR